MTLVEYLRSVSHARYWGESLVARGNRKRGDLKTGSQRDKEASMTGVGVLGESWRRACELIVGHSSDPVPKGPGRPC